MNNIIIFIAVLSFILYATLLWRKLGALQDKIKVREKAKQNQVQLSLQREKLENIAISANNTLISTYVRFGDLNHLLLANNNTDLTVSKHVVDYSFFERLGLDPAAINVEEGFVTCLMPFNKQYTKVYDCIKNICFTNGCKCHRSDDEFRPNSILKYTMELILKSQIIIAVLDGRNANVYYEVGIAHSIGKTVILVSNVSRFKDMPFDIKGNRFVLYKDTSDLRTQLDRILKNIYDAR